MRSYNKVIISAPARIHIALISMGDDSFRKYGGAGFAIRGFDTVIEAECSNSGYSYIRDERHSGASFNKDKLNSIQRRLDDISESLKLNKVGILVSDSPPQNSGFGSGTSLELACIEALLLCNDCKVSEAQIVELSSRGGTSGIGIKTYFQGGFVFDLGVPADGEFLPSSASKGTSPKALQSIRWRFPEWAISVFLPKYCSFTPSGAYEIGFFKDNAPVKIDEVNRMSFLAIFAILPAIMEENIGMFSEALSELQELGWKRVEWAQYGDVLMRCRASLMDSGFHDIGLSSMGPAMYCLSESLDAEFRIPEEFYFRCVMPNNTGRLINIC